MKAALEYGLFTQHFFDSLSPEERILGDHHILNSLIQADNEAQKKALKKSDDDRKHPGMERFDSMDEFWDEVDDANH
jgi:hypothetical protein